METTEKINLLKKCRVIYPFKKDIPLKEIEVKESDFLGKGSFASVYNYNDKSEMCLKENSCALKFLKTEKTNKKTIEKEMKNIIMQIVLYKKMEEEIKKLKLEGVVPRIPKIYEIGVYETEDGKNEFYIIMENTGKSLEKYLKENKDSLTLEQKLELFKQIAFCVKLMHYSGFIHRDLKPDNTTIKKIDGKDVCYLIDFGFIGHKTMSVNDIKSLGIENIKRTLLEIYATLKLPHDEKFISFCELNQNDSLLCFGYKGTVNYHPPEIVGKFLGEGKYFTKKFKKYAEVFPKIAEGCRNFELENLGEEYDIYSLGVILLDILNTDQDNNVFNISEDKEFVKTNLKSFEEKFSKELLDINVKKRYSGEVSRMVKIRNICRRNDNKLQDFLQENLKILLNSRPNLLNFVKQILKNKASERIKIGPLCEKLEDINSLLTSAAPTSQPVPQPLPKAVPQPVAKDVPQLLPKAVPQPLPKAVPQPLPKVVPQAVPKSVPQPTTQPVSKDVPQSNNSGINSKTQKANTQKANTQKANTQKANTQKANTQKANTQKANTQKANTQKANTQKANTQKANTQKTNSGINISNNKAQKGGKKSKKKYKKKSKKKSNKYKKMKKNKKISKKK